MLTIHVPGPPRGKGRPRFTRQGHAFTDHKTRTAEADIRAIFREKYPHHEPLSGPLEMTIIAKLQIPKSASRKVREQMRLGQIRPTKRPDWDNLGKLFSDALNGIAFIDDCQIVDCSVEKWYGENPGLEAKILTPGEDI